MNKLDLSALWSSQTITISSLPVVLLSILLAFGLGMFIFFVYKMNYRGVMYSANFGTTLVLMTLITTPVVMCIRESIQLSMGMVGALSIVRFRTAVKDPLDTAYMFWALTMGILLGAGQFFLAIVASVLIAGLIFLLTRISFKSADSYLLVVRGAASSEPALAQIMTKTNRASMKSKTVNGNGFEMTYEVRVEKPDAFLGRVLSIAGVQDATLVAYQNETV
ncbi:MAG: DUF4956 domain-containing protein [Eubacteriales bacterium]|nr:DUF4956 domain-containing protein [Eubacteriales bacterium]